VIFSYLCDNTDSKPGLVKQFIVDLNSGKLHREFHQGPDPLPPAPVAPPVEKKPAEPVSDMCLFL